MKTSTPFIEFIEWFDAVDVKSAALVCRELPSGYGCTITREQTFDLNGDPHGYVFVRKTKSHGKGSIRYCPHGSLEKAYAAARVWAERKVAEASRP